jgi:hypothetical protein
MLRHASAQARHIFEQTPQISACRSEVRNMKFALVWQISAQSCKTV